MQPDAVVMLVKARHHPEHGGIWNYWPMPNDSIISADTRFLVVASVVYGEGGDERFAGNDTFTVLLLADGSRSPYFICAQIERCTELQADMSFKPVFWNYHHNIVPAVEQYEESGGDY